MGTTKSNNMRCIIALILVAVLIAPAHSTSLAAATLKIWTAADCSGTLIEDKFIMNPPTDGSCMQARNENEDSNGNKFDPPTYETFYRKATCTANTATNGYSSKKYTDSSCTTARTTGSDNSIEVPTGTCQSITDGSATVYRQFGCASTSATVGAALYGAYSAAGCADSTLTSGGYFAINFCAMESNNGAVTKSKKWVIEGGKLQEYEYTAANKDCSAGGTAMVNSTYSSDACSASLKNPGTEWYKISAVIDGASIAGYSTLAGNTATSAAISVFLGVVCTVLNLMFCQLEQIGRAHMVLAFVSHE